MTVENAFNQQFYNSVIHPSLCLFSLLPPPRDSTFQTAFCIKIPVTRAKRYTSFIHHAVLSYRNSSAHTASLPLYYSNINPILL